MASTNGFLGDVRLPESFQSAWGKGVRRVGSTYQREQSGDETIEQITEDSITRDISASGFKLSKS